MDSALLQRYARKGDADAFAELVRRYAYLVYGTCLRTTGNPQDAEDAAQECFLELAKKAGNINSSLPGWIHRVARGKSIDLIRNDVRRKVREDKVSLQTACSHEPTWAEIVPYVDEALNALPEPLKSIVLLHYFDGLTQAEVADRLGVSQPSVSRTLEKSISLLRNHLEKAGIVLSIAALTLLVSSHQASAAPETLVASGMKIGLSGIGRASTGIRLLAASTKGALITKVITGTLAVIAVTGFSLFAFRKTAQIPHSQIGATKAVQQNVQQSNQVEEIARNLAIVAYNDDMTAFQHELTRHGISKCKDKSFFQRISSRARKHGAIRSVKLEVVDRIIPCPSGKGMSAGPYPGFATCRITCEHGFYRIGTYVENGTLKAFEYNFDDIGLGGGRFGPLKHAQTISSPPRHFLSKLQLLNLICFY